MERTAQNKKRERCCQIGKLSDWLFYARRQGNPQYNKDQSDQRAENHGIGQHALEKREYPNVVSAEILQNHDGKDIINRNNNCNHGGFAEIAGAKATIAHLPGIKLKQLQVSLPPLSLQNEFAAFVERVDQQKQTVQKSLEKLELMKKALMQEYFG